MQLMKAQSGFCQKFATDAALISGHEKLADPPAQEPSQSETVQQLAPTVPQDARYDVDFRYGYRAAQRTQSLTIVGSSSYVVSLRN